jgi:hypothetical protein
MSNEKIEKGPSDSGFHFLLNYLRCQEYFRWGTVEGLEPTHTPHQLLYGTAMHYAMETWFRNIGKGAITQLDKSTDAFEKAMEEIESDFQDEQSFNDSMAKGRSLIPVYTSNYVHDEDSWEVLKLPDGRECIELSLAMEFPGGDALTGRIDLVMRNKGSGKVYIWDHKTTSWSISQLSRTLMVGDQSTSYISLWQQNFPNIPIEGVIFNVLYYNRGKMDFARPVIEKTQEDIDRFSMDAEYLLNEIATKSGDPEARWVRNTAACYLYNRPCPYLDLCQGANYKFLIGTQFRQREEDEKVMAE